MASLQDLLQRAEHFLSEGQTRQAVDCFLQMLEQHPQLPAIRMDVCVLLLQLGNLALLQEVIAGFSEPSPQAAQAYAALGVFYEQRQQYPLALQAFGTALQQDANQSMLWNYQARSQMHLGQWQDAAKSIEQALQRAPETAEYHFVSASIAHAAGQFAQAEQEFMQCLHCDPAYEAAYLPLAMLYRQQGLQALAHQWLQQALQRFPQGDFLQGTGCMLSMESADWTQWGAEVQSVLCAIDAGRLVALPHLVLALPATERQQNNNAARVIDAVFADQRSKESIIINKNRRAGRLRVAYVSSDFGQHAVSVLMAGLFERHDRQRFEIFLYSLQSRRGDPLLQRLQAQAEHFVDLSTWEDAAIVALAREHDLDIAVDLNGHTQGARTRLFALGLAPVQVHYLGFPGGMGAAYYDYILADAIVIPLAHRQYYREKVVYLPGCFQVNDEQREAPVPLRRAELGWPEAAFVFCCFNGTYKLNPLLFAVWMAVLRACPEAVLALLGESGEVVAHLRQEATAAGVEAQRLHFATRQPYARHLGRLAAADLVLDTLPFNGGTSSSDALWAGVPVLTCTGDTFAGRMSTSLLHRAGLTELIVGSLEDYVAVATALYNNQARLQGIRAQLQSNAVRQRLFATEPTTRAIEQAYLTMHQRRIAGLLPDSFSVGGGSCC